MSLVLPVVRILNTRVVMGVLSQIGSRGQTVYSFGADSLALVPNCSGPRCLGPNCLGLFCQEPIGLPLVVGKLGLDNLKHECLGPIYVKLGGGGGACSINIGSVLPQLAKFGNKI